MQLMMQTDYALRILMFLASKSKRGTVAEIARLFGISPNHVAKVVNQLARLGYVLSVRGVGGGMDLARPPEEIRLGEVIEQFEGNLHLLECLGKEDACAIQSFCRLRGVLAEAERRQLAYLNSVTLADVVPTRRELFPLES